MILGAQSLRTSQKLATVALGVFLLSHFLPADDGMIGFGCFWSCVGVLFRPGDMDASKWGLYLYYSAFVLTNVLFPVLALMLFNLARSFPRVRWWLAPIILLHVFSWLPMSMERLSQIQIGYYMWLVSYVLLLTATILSKTERILLTA